MTSDDMTLSTSDAAIESFVEAFRNDLSTMVEHVAKWKKEEVISKLTVDTAASRLIDMQSIEEHFSGKYFSELADKLID